MKNITFLTLVLSLFFLNQIFAQKEITEMNINGMQLIFKQAENDVVVVNLFIKGGAANLTPETAGIENYALQVAVTGGTKNYAKDEFNKNLEKLGSTITASSSNDFSVISLRCVKDNFAKTWELYENVILNPLFDEIEVNLTRDKITSSIKTEDANPDALIRKTMVKWYFEGHPYSNRPIGTTENIQKFSPDDLKNYYKQILENSRLLMVAVGRLDKKDLEKKTNALSSKLPAGSYKDTKLSPPKRSESSEYQIVEKPLPTNYIMGQYLLPNMNEPYYYAALLSHSILRDRVFEEVRTKRNLSYAPVAAMTTQKTSTGFIYVSTTNPDTAIMVMLDELNKLKTETIPEKDMKNHKMRFLTLDYMRQETNAMQAGALAAAQIYTGSWKNVALFVENINKVTGDDIKTMSNDYINNLNFVYVGKKNKVNEEILKTK
ncbi:MAG: insulinase family protein [Bacteroidetes bacterium]|nr:insulinase family protein [Bacteroidota bacterium]